MIAQLTGSMPPRAVLVESAGRYLHWGVIQISLTNFLIIVGMVVLFVIALLAPFPGSRVDDTDQDKSDDSR